MMLVCDKCNQIKTKKLPPKKPKRKPRKMVWELCSSCNSVETYNKDELGHPFCRICESEKNKKLR